MKKTSKALIEEESLAQVTTLTDEQARALHGPSGPQWVDVHDLQELEHEGMVPGLHHASHGLQEARLDEGKPQQVPMFADEKEYVLFNAADWRSTQSAQALMDAGLTESAHRPVGPHPGKNRKQAGS